MIDDQVKSGRGLDVTNEELDATPVATTSGINKPNVSRRNVESAFKNRLRSGVITNRKHLDYDAFMDDAKKLFQSKIDEVLKQYDAVKVSGTLSAEFFVIKADVETKDIKHFNTSYESIFATTNLDQWFDENLRKPIACSMEEFQEKDSGWSLRSILHLAIHINKLNPMRGSCKVPLPDDIKKKHACVNIENEDQKCFLWAVLAGLHPVRKNKKNISHYKRFENTLNFKGIDFPVKPKGIPKFERQNDVSVNVYILKKYGDVHKVSPLHLSTEYKNNHVRLLLVQDFYVDEDACEGDDDANVDSTAEIPTYHYVLITDLSRLVRSQLSRHGHRCYICDRCLHFF